MDGGSNFLDLSRNKERTAGVVAEDPDKKIEGELADDESSKRTGPKSKRKHQLGVRKAAEPAPAQTAAESLPISDDGANVLPEPDPDAESDPESDPHPHPAPSTLLLIIKHSPPPPPPGERLRSAPLDATRRLRSPLALAAASRWRDQRPRSFLRLCASRTEHSNRPPPPHRPTDDRNLPQSATICHNLPQSAAHELGPRRGLGPNSRVRLEAPD